MIAIVVAVGKRGEMGKNGKLPWYLPEDLKYFKQLTTGHTVVMGRKTYQSIGKPLPNRRNIILTRKREGGDMSIINHPDLVMAHSVDDVLDYTKADKGDTFIIGGAEIYTLFLPYAEKLYITRIDQAFEADTFFPLNHLAEWDLMSVIQGKTDDKNPHRYRFEIYGRKASCVER